MEAVGNAVSNIESVSKLAAHVRAELGKIIVGQEPIIDQFLLSSEAKWRRVSTAALRRTGRRKSGRMIPSRRQFRPLRRIRGKRTSQHLRCTRGQTASHSGSFSFRSKA